MKRLVIVILLFAGSFGMAHAQTIQHKSKKKETASATIANSKTAKVEKSTSTTHLKADGTPDKRYKENKVTVKTVGPMKKNGTPDMRYKANKKK